MRVTLEFDFFSPACAEGLLTLSGIRTGEEAPLPFPDGEAPPRLWDAVPSFDYAVVPFRREIAAQRDAVDRLREALGDRCFPVPLPYGVAQITALLRSLETAPALPSPSADDRVRANAAEHGEAPAGGDGEEKAFPALSGDGEDRAVALLPLRHSVARGGREVRLTPREFELFALLYEARGAVVTRDEIHAALFGRRERKKSSNPADVYAQYLRRKLKPLFGDGVILSARGKGYYLRLPARE